MERNCYFLPDSSSKSVSMGRKKENMKEVKYIFKKQQFKVPNNLTQLSEALLLQILPVSVWYSYS